MGEEKELPRGWVKSFIGEIISLEYGKSLPSQKRSGSGYPVFGSNGIVGYHETALVKGPGIVVGRKGSHGEVTWVDEDFFPIDTTYFVQTKGSLNLRFIYSLLKACDFKSLNRSTAIPGLNRNDAYQIKIPLPPLPEQHRIVAKLDALMARVAALEAGLARIPQLLANFRQSVLSKAVTGALTEEWRAGKELDSKKLCYKIRQSHLEQGGHKKGNAALPNKEVHESSFQDLPAEWECCTIRDLCRPEKPVTYGILKPGPEIDGGRPYLKVMSYPKNRIDFNKIRHTTEEIENNYKRARLATGDIVLSIRGTVGRVIIIPDRLNHANITQDSARISLQPGVSNKYVLYSLLSPILQDVMKRVSKGVAVKGINIGDVRHLRIPIPSSEEQAEIVRRVESLFAKADAIEESYEALKQKVETLPQAILAKAFRGELVPQLPEDGDARALLAEIRALRAGKSKKNIAR